MYGAPTSALDANDDVKKIAKDVKADTEKKLGTTFTDFDAVKYKTQVVAGTNYFIKVKVGADKYVHITVWQKLPCNGGNLDLTDAVAGKTLNDPL